MMYGRLVQSISSNAVTLFELPHIASAPATVMFKTYPKRREVLYVLRLRYATGSLWGN